MDGPHDLRRELYERAQRDAGLFEFLSEVSLDGLWLWDLERPGEGWVSPRLQGTLGYSGRDGSGGAQWWQERVQPEDRPRLLGGLRRLAEEPGSTFDEELRFRHRDGSVVLLRCRALALRDGAGRVVRVVCAHIDLTARRSAEARLELAMRAYVDLYENAPDPYFSIDAASGLLVRCNATLAACLGCAREELLGRPHLDLYAASSQAAAAAALRDSLERRPVRNVLLQAQRRGGGTIEVSLSAEAVLDPEAATLRCRASWRDVSEQRRADELATVIEAAPSAILLVGDEGLIRLANEEAERAFGFPSGELIGKPVEVLVPERHREAHRALRSAFLASPRRRPMGADQALVGRRRDGSEFPMEVGLKPVQTGGRTRVLASIIDISARKRAEELSARRRAELERSNAELAQLAQVASHELQEPLRAVVRFAELLSERYEGRLDERADRYLGHILDGARRMRRLVSDLLSYARAGGGAGPSPSADVSAVLKQVLEDMSAQLSAAGAVIERGPLPRVLVDPLQLGQVLRNLIDNAVKFRAARPLRIAISAERAGGEWRVAVRDNGIGFDPQQAGRLFQMFQRLHDRGRYEGCGIGLALVRRIVERHGGSAGIESTPGEGCTVSFSLPAGVEPPEARD